MASRLDNNWVVIVGNGPQIEKVVGPFSPSRASYISSLCRTSWDHNGYAENQPLNRWVICHKLVNAHEMMQYDSDEYGTGKQVKRP